jgi:hypothetical protein
MLLLRGVVLLMLGASVICFAVYASTGSMQYRRLGVRILKWTLAAGFLFFAVLILQRLKTFF